MKTMSLILTLLFSFYGLAQAGPFTDEMSKCLVTSTSKSDKTLFVQWIYTAMSVHPDVQPMSNITPAIEENLNKGVADMVMNLLTVRCKAETEKAIKFEGQSSFVAGFELLGKAAMQELMSHPKVTQFLSSLDRYFDANTLKNTFGMQ